MNDCLLVEYCVLQGVEIALSTLIPELSKILDYISIHRRLCDFSLISMTSIHKRNKRNII